MVCINGYGLRLFAIRLVHASVIPILGCGFTWQELRILHVLRVELDITGITQLGGFRRIQEIILQTQCRHNTHVRLLVRSQVCHRYRVLQVLLVVIQLRVLCDIEIHIRIVPILVLPEDRSVRHLLTGDVQQVSTLLIVLVIIRISDSKFRRKHHP